MILTPFYVAVTSCFYDVVAKQDTEILRLLILLPVYYLSYSC